MSDGLDMLVRHRVANRILRPGAARSDAPQAVGAGLRGRDAAALGRGQGLVTAVRLGDCGLDGSSCEPQRASALSHSRPVDSIK